MKSLVKTDPDGYLLDISCWTEDLANELAKGRGVEMSNHHWLVINVLRDFYEEYKTAPMIRILNKSIGKAAVGKNGKRVPGLLEAMGLNTNSTVKEAQAAAGSFTYKLFPGGPAKDACLIAGLPKPTGCV